MVRQFLRTQPLQACKLAAIIVVVSISVAVFGELVSNPNVMSLFLVPLLGLGLVLVIGVETLLASYRFIRSGESLTDRLLARPVYTLVRGVELVLALLGVGLFIAVIVALPPGPMAGPGAIGLWMITVGLGVLVVGGSLVRTFAEYYRYRSSTVV